MIKCIAVDDEPLALKKMKKYISQVPELELVALCKSTSEAREAMLSNRIDLIFLDINMPDESGLAFARTLLDSNAPSVVFTTAYPEFALEGYKVDALDYMLKPFDFEEFQSTVQRIAKRFDYEAAEQAEEDMLYIKIDYKTRSVRMSDIRYVETHGEYVRIYLVRTEEPLVPLLSMKKLEERLPSEQFMRIHRSYIINLSQIKSVGKGRVVMDEDTSLPIGDVFREKFNTYIASRSVK